MGSNLRDVDTPENEMLSSELKKIVFDTINGLQEDLRTAITLRELEGLSYEDICRNYGLSSWNCSLSNFPCA